MKALFTVEEKRNLVCSLPEKEYEIYLWLRNAYSVRWIAETLCTEKKDIKKTAAGVYKTLLVCNQRDLISQYGTLDRPKEFFSDSVSASSSVNIDSLVFDVTLYSERGYTEK